MTCLPSFASDYSYYDEVSFNIGMVNVSFAESQVALQGPNQDEPASGAVSSISGQIHYRLTGNERRSYYAAATFPMMNSTGNTYFSLGGGAEFYFSSVGSKFKLEDSVSSIKVMPKIRYFWGIEANIAYLVYVTETAKKSDTVLELGPLVGLSYTWSRNWALRAHGAFARGVGVNTSTTGMKVMLGGTYFLD